MAILPFMLYQLAGFGTLGYVVPKAVNWIINVAILGLTMAAYVSNRQGDYGAEKTFVVVLIVAMAVTVVYGVLQLKKMQIEFDLRRPTKDVK